MILILASCGKKSIVENSPFGPAKTPIEITDEVKEADVSERACIDNKLNKDLDAGEAIEKMIANSDFTFCNGVRVRLKSYLFDSKKYKAYGFIQSNSRHSSCLTASDDYTTNFLGDRGVLVGRNMKLLVGGHELGSDNKVIPSSHMRARYVKYGWGTYSGELGFYENGRVRCWGIQ